MAKVNASNEKSMDIYPCQEQWKEGFYLFHLPAENLKS